MPTRPLIVLLAAAAIAGCGGDPTLSASRSDELHARVAAVREAAGKGDRAGALKSLDGLEAAVRDLEAGGSLAQADADALRRGIGRARRRVRAEIAKPTPAPTPTAEPTAAPAPEEPEEQDGGEPDKGNDDDKGKGETEGKGKAKGKKGKDG
jgi:hypothetical protein